MVKKNDESSLSTISLKMRSERAIATVLQSVAELSRGKYKIQIEYIYIFTTLYAKGEK